VSCSDATRRNSKLNKRALRSAQKRAVRTAQKPELAPEDLQGDTPQQQWQYSVSNMAGAALSDMVFTAGSAALRH
jgi:hypothetical protein